MIANGTGSSGLSLNYLWTTSEGKIVGLDTQSTARLFGSGTYNLKVSDSHGCTSDQSFLFPATYYQIIANADYARTSWDNDTTINVLNNDVSTVLVIPGTVQVITKPAHGSTKVNNDGTITYTPDQRLPLRDQFVYQVCNELNMCASATVTIDVYDSEVTYPNGFSPNGDGINDHLEFTGLEKYPGSQLAIYTRSGLLIYENTDYQNNWDGKNTSKALNALESVPTGTYYYVLKLGGTNRILKGFIYIGY